MHSTIQKIVVMILTILITGCSHQKTDTVPLETAETESTQFEETADTVFVHVCGAVAQEGVYELQVGSRVYEAIEQAGGFLENAAVTSINQAELVEDETRIYIPTIEELESMESQGIEKVNLNTAGLEKLMTLPGVGEAKATQIIQYRETNGNFQKIEDIMKISGIKEGLFNKIKDYIRV